MDDLNKARQQNQNSQKCEICDKEFKNKNSLRIHFKNVHNFEKEHQCNICQKDFKFLSQLTSHMKITHENKKHDKCESCGKSFSNAGNLKIHINSNSHTRYCDWLQRQNQLLPNGTKMN